MRTAAVVASARQKPAPDENGDVILLIAIQSEHLHLPS